MKRTIIAAVATCMVLAGHVWVGEPLARADYPVGCCNDVCCWMDDSTLCENPPIGCEDGPAYPFPMY
jgi:hypothetical protein